MIYRTRSEIVAAVEQQSSLHVGGSKSRLYYCTAWIIKSALTKIKYAPLLKAAHFLCKFLIRTIYY